MSRFGFLSRVAFSIVAVSAMGWAQPHPNFTGTWKINVAESDYSDKRAVVPDRLVLTVQHRNDKLKLRNDWERAGKKNNFDFELTIGGAAHESDAAGIVTAEWKGDALVVSYLYNPGTERQSNQVETWTLAPDGKRMLEQVVVHPPGDRPEVRIKRVFDKQ